MLRIRALALDVDGVLTDGTFWWGADGEEYKRFSFADVMGISLARKAGLFVTLISGEDNPLVDRYARKLGLSRTYKGCTDKASALRAFAESNALRLDEVCFMGDDVNDVGAMRIAGLGAAPADAQASALAAASFVSRFPGGKGAVRELVDSILAARSAVAVSLSSS